ncbi:MAG: Gfo/Idh/MocA family oxidoreductase [Planctomycetota bacterium]|jgi:predicted dehydrogenase|nr:Gfo/Idh/MocA family oxidoreductase [Planctomycetota bacterium]MDP7254861.1 Gfo/Idh/MocA family oxidoreductase [Planctomycetota bacterium]
MSSFKIAMLQCEKGERDECHSYHYAPFMDDCDPMVLKEVWPTSYQFHTDLNHPNEFANVEKADGFEIASVWDIQGTARGETFSRYVDRRPRVCATMDEATEGVDGVFLADGGGDGSEHLEWVEPILRKRIPVFVDKPFASKFEEASAMVKLAEETGTPIFTASILSY